MTTYDDDDNDSDNDDDDEKNKSNNLRMLIYNLCPKSFRIDCVNWRTEY
jgi:hypothetical protein